MNLATIHFSPDNALACAQASAAAYQSATVSCAATDTHCLVIEEADHIILAFRGTTSIRNWITDAEFERKRMIFDQRDNCSEIHEGFVYAFDSILPALSGCLNKIVAGNRAMYVTGHSLGGALAILCALHLKRQGFPVFQVYTFGQPRVGNGCFCRLYNAALGRDTFRVVFEEDIVPRVPHLPSLHDPYRHAGQEIFFDAIYGGAWINPPWWRLLASDLWGLYRALEIRHFAAAIDPIVDHHVDNYVTAASTLNAQPVPR